MSTRLRFGRPLKVSAVGVDTVTCRGAHSVRLVIRCLRLILKMHTRRVELKKMAARICAPAKIPQVAYDEAVELSSSFTSLVDIVPDTQKLLTCQFVKAFASASAFVRRNHMGFDLPVAGNSVVATALFGLWFTLVIAVQRLSNKDLLVKNMMGAMKSFRDMSRGSKGSLPRFSQRIKSVFGRLEKN